MSNVTSFPTPRERAGVTMMEDMDLLLDALVDAALALRHSENVPEEDREGDLEVMAEMVVKYFRIRGERYPEDDDS